MRASRRVCSAMLFGAKSRCANSRGIILRLGCVWSACRWSRRHSSTHLSWTSASNSSSVGGLTPSVRCRFATSRSASCSRESFEAISEQGTRLAYDEAAAYFRARLGIIGAARCSSAWAPPPRPPPATRLFERCRVGEIESMHSTNFPVKQQYHCCCAEYHPSTHPCSHLSALSLSSGEAVASRAP